MKIGTVTIGQAPRVDLIPELKEAIGLPVEILERGALDNLTLEEVKALHPQAGDYVLVTRMRDGREVKIAERHITQRMKERVAELEQQGVELIILVCTGEFPELTSGKLILKPERLMAKMIRAILPRGEMAVVVPSPDQIQLTRKKWAKNKLELVIEAVSPYTGTTAEKEEVAGRIASTAAELVVLDCIGFDRETKSIFRNITRKPVILPRTLMGRAAAELLES